MEALGGLWVRTTPVFASKIPGFLEGSIGYSFYVSCAILLTFLRCQVPHRRPISTSKGTDMSKWLEPPIMVPAACVVIFMAYLLYRSYA
jgi:hypothetical protein